MIPNYRVQTLETIARTIIKSYDPSLLVSVKAIPIEDIIERHYGLILEYQYIRNNGRLLGETIFDDTVTPIYDMEKREYTLTYVKRGTIIIDASLLIPRSYGRFRFTCAHELAHWIIHQDIYLGTGNSAAMTLKPEKSSEVEAIIERQADYLSACLLMPMGQVKIAYHRTFRETNDVVENLAKIFEVSKQAMEIRLKSLNLI